MGEIRLNSLNMGGDNKPLRPAQNDTQNYYRQQDVFSAFKEHTQKTKEIDNVHIDITDNDASKRDKQAFDILARPYNMSGFKVMKNSDMFDALVKMNKGDFTIGINDRGEEVVLFDPAKSDGKIKICSVEQDENGNEYYALEDEDGQIQKFDTEGNIIK